MVLSQHFQKFAKKESKTIKDRISTTALDEIATAEGQSIKTAVAVNTKNPTLSGLARAFGDWNCLWIEEGATSELIAGNSGVYAVQVTKVTAASELPSYRCCQQGRESQGKGGQYPVVHVPKEAADIEDNRSTFLRIQEIIKKD